MTLNIKELERKVDQALDMETPESLRAFLSNKRSPKKRSHPESALQIACVKWFRLQYPKYRMLLFSIPNGGARSNIQRQLLTAEGVVNGVADLFLSVPAMKGSLNIHGVYIEMKAGKNKMSAVQWQFRNEVTALGYFHAVCYSFDEFQLVINSYLK